MNWFVELPKRNYTSVPLHPVKPSKDFRAMAKSGHCSKLDGGERASSPTVSACFAVRLVPEYAGYGTVRTMCGPRSTANTNGDGSTSTRVKRYGTTQEHTLKVRFVPTILLGTDTNTILFRLESQTCLLHRLLQRRCNRRHSSLHTQLPLSARQDSMSRRSPPLDHARNSQDSKGEHGQIRTSKTDAGG